MDLGYEDFPETPTDTSLSRLHNLVGELRQARRQAAIAKSVADKLAGRVAELEEDLIPELMDRLGFRSYESSDGAIKLKLKDKVITSITKKAENDAYAWLDANGHGGMIRREVVVAFNRDQEEDAAELRQSLRGKYPGVGERCAIHPSTLRAWVTRQLKEGEEIPDSIYVDVKTVAQIQEASNGR